jgi:uncharacterized protein YqeY
MNILEELKQKQLKARKEKDEMASFLITLYSEVAMVGKNKGNTETTNEDALTVIKKFKSGATEFWAAADMLNDQLKIDKISKEIEILDSLLDEYVPKQMSTEMLEVVISNLIAETNSSQIGPVMGQLKRRFNGQYDGAIAIEIVKQMLSVE